MYDASFLQRNHSFPSQYQSSHLVVVKFVMLLLVIVYHKTPEVIIVFYIVLTKYKLQSLVKGTIALFQSCFFLLLQKWCARIPWFQQVQLQARRNSGNRSRANFLLDWKTSPMTIYVCSRCRWCPSKFFHTLPRVRLESFDFQQYFNLWMQQKIKRI